MEQTARFAERLVDIVLNEGGFMALLVFLGLCYFAYLYFAEKRRNRELTNMILDNSKSHADKFVDVVTNGIEADNRLALTISQLTSIITDIKARLDNLAESSKPTRRR